MKTTFAAILIIAFAATVALPITKADSPLVLQIYCFLSCEPDPVGVGQTLTINAFTQPIPPTANDRFNNISVTMTKPDGTKQTFGPVIGGPLGNWIWTYNPDTAGTYLFQMHVGDSPFPNSRGGNVLYKGSDGPIVNVTVQQEPIVRAPETPLPTEYWTYPINAQNHDWCAISGPSRNGYANSGYNPFTTAPSAHVLWRFRNAFGGIEGGENGPVAYALGRAYEGKMTPSIVINNYFYQYGPVGDRVNSPLNQLNCIDINTGQVVWTKAITSGGVGVGTISLVPQVFEFDSSNQVGLHSYLWYMGSANWSMYDAFNGNWIMDFVNVTSSGGKVVTFEPSGNMLAYMLDTTKGWLACWNFTKACIGTGTGDGVITWQAQSEKDQYGVAGGQWRPSSSVRTNDWMRGIEWNVTVPIESQYMSPTMSASFSWGKISGPQGIGIAEALWNDPVLVPKDIKEIFGYDLSNAHPGKLFGPVNLTTTANTASAISADDGVYIQNNREHMTYIAYDIHTGQRLWESDPLTYPWGSYASLGPTIANHKLYAADYDGLGCWDIKTGHKLWLFSAGNSGTETPYGTWVGNGLRMGGGAVYYYTGAWHAEQIMERGNRLFCVNDTTGQNIWNMTFFGDGGVLANGKLIIANGYDNEIYCFGKGQSATTVSAPQTTVTAGSSVLIQGTVMDQTPGLTKDTACIGEDWMGPWMDYIYSQQPKPANAIGVPVSIDAYDPNGNFIHLGDATSDTAGVYRLAVDPSKLEAGAGMYSIVATFKGTNSYWQSSAETTLIMGAAAAATPGATTTAVSGDVMNAITTSAIAIGIVVVLAIAIATMLILRRKP